MGWFAVQCFAGGKPEPRSVHLKPCNARCSLPSIARGWPLIGSKPACHKNERPILRRTLNRLPLSPSLLSLELFDGGEGFREQSVAII
jgi:hypothetical protein